MDHIKIMRKPVINLSFDDGRKDNYDIAFPILKKYGLTATFNISTAYVDGTINSKDSPCINPAMTVDEVIKLNNCGFEIACHGDCHKNDWNDVVSGLSKLRIWLGWDENYKPGFASPESNLSSDEIKKKKDKFGNLFAYMRIASYSKESMAIRIIRKIAHISHSKNLYSRAFVDNIGGIKDGFIAVSVPIINQATIDQVIAIVKYAIKAKRDVILMFHSIVPRDDIYASDMWSWEAGKFDKLCHWLKEEADAGHFDVLRTMDLI